MEIFHPQQPHPWAVAASLQPPSPAGRLLHSSALIGLPLALPPWGTATSCLLPKSQGASPSPLAPSLLPLHCRWSCH